MSMLKIDDIHVYYGAIHAIKGVSFEVNEGEIVALIGPNGAGKTTAFNCVTGVYQPTNGIVSFEGNVIVRGTPKGKMKKEYAGENAELYASQRVIDPTPDEITKLGIARTFQNIRLWKSMTVFENVLIAKHMHSQSSFFSAALHTNKADEKRMREEAMTLLEEQGLDKYKDEIATSLPYGLQRRLEIARALAAEPRLLLLDEPAAGMNPHETEELMQTIRYIRDTFDMTILLIEHDMKFVSGLCDEVTVLNFGTVLAQGKTKDALSDPEVVKAYIGG